MPTEDAIFVIPSNRLRDVGETVEAYDEHFRRNGHAVSIFVFDDSSVVNQQKYYSALEKTCTHNPLYYVGPHEKEQFLAYLFARLNDRKLDLLVRNLFRQRFASGHMRDHLGALSRWQAAEAEKRHVRVADPGWRELRAEGNDHEKP